MLIDIGEWNAVLPNLNAPNFYSFWKYILFKAAG